MKTYYLFLLAALAGCAVQKSSPDLDLGARKLIAPTGKALVYIVRPEIFGAAVRGVVNCDNVYLGSLGGARFIFTVQEPGKHSFEGIAENKSKLETELEPGKIYFFEQRVTFGKFYARNRMILLDEEQGRKKLAQCKLSADCVAQL